jgi:hypothetical protein
MLLGVIAFPAEVGTLQAMTSNIQIPATDSFSTAEPYFVMLVMFNDRPWRIEARTPGAFFSEPCYVLAVFLNGELHVAQEDEQGVPATLPTGVDNNPHSLRRLAALYGYDAEMLIASYESVLSVLRSDADVRTEFDAFMRGERAWGPAFVTDTLDKVGSHVVTYLDRNFVLADADPADLRTAVLAGVSSAAGVIEYPSADTGIDMGIAFLAAIHARSLAAAEDIQTNEFSREIEMHEWRESLAARGLSETDIGLLGSISLTTMLILETHLRWEPSETIGGAFRKAALEVLSAVSVVSAQESTPAASSTPSAEEKLTEMMSLLHLDEDDARADCDVASLIAHITDVRAVLPDNAAAVREAVSWAVFRVMHMNGVMTATISAFETTTDGLPDPMELARLLASG